MGYLTLTDRQRAILTLVAEGKTGEQIAQELGITFGQYSGNLTAIYNALGATNRTHAVAIALGAGLLTVRP